MNNVSLILTVIGDDRHGIVEQLSSAISKHQGNWIDAALSNLAGHFAGVVRFTVPEHQVVAVQKTLASIPDIIVSFHVAEDRKDMQRFNPLGRRNLKLSMVGKDRIGLVRQISQVLSRHFINVEDISTYTSRDVVSASVLFHTTAALTSPIDLDTQLLTRGLEQLSNELMVDISLDEIVKK